MKVHVLNLTRTPSLCESLGFIAMVGLRKACSVVLLAWVVLNPLGLAWHHALSHGSSSYTSSECGVVESCVDVQTDPCPFGNSELAEFRTRSACESSKRCPEGNDDPCNDEPCQVCELLWHDDVVVSFWFTVPDSCESISEQAIGAPRSVAVEVLFSWSVRGPPRVV